MKTFPVPSQNTRLGFNYFPDANHYRESDLQKWLPQLQTLRASWLVLDAPADRAIPESFLRGLIQSGIEPVLHLRVPVEPPPPLNDLRLLFQTYARWGVHYVVIFDRPNQRLSWPSSGWAQSNLVERFLDIYLPLAEAALHAGLIPVLPPLEPGGDYWDTAFLRAALQGLRRRGCLGLLESLVIGAYAWTGGRTLSWGSGGPECWPAARPYFTPPGSEDQIGFHIFDWYLAVASAVLEARPRILILGGGARLGEPNTPAASPQNHALVNVQIASALAGLPSSETPLPVIPDEVLAHNFWLLTADSSSPFADQAWVRADGTTIPAVHEFTRLFSGRVRPSPPPASAAPDLRRTNGSSHSDPFSVPHAAPQSAPQAAPHAAPHAAPPTAPYAAPDGARAARSKPFRHYLLLPVYEWGVSDWHLEVIQPFVKKHRPSVGFSLDEAKHAEMVTVVGGSQTFPDPLIDELLKAGCTVRQINGDGTNIASQLASL
jgi:hypothetical protein